MGELQRQEKERLHKLKSKIHAAGPTFKPEINSKSDAIVRRLEEMTHWVPDPHVRLSAKPPGAVLRSIERKMHEEQKRKASCPFKPKVNITSKMIIDSSDIMASKSFIERQDVFEKIASYNQHELKEQK